LIRVIQECNKSKIKLFNAEERSKYFGLQIKDRVRSRSWLTKHVVKKAIRKELSKEDYKLYGVDIMNAILETGELVTDDEVITLMEAANV
jgi:predicted transcriptional regulator